MKHIVFTVTNDLSLDQRMHRICSALSSNGYKCTLVGRLRSSSLGLHDQTYSQHRIPCLFERGKLFYFEYNLKLLVYLIFTKADIICSIDLDTALPGYLSSALKGKELVFDAHEYFTEMEEIVERPSILIAWRSLERFLMKRITHAYTISDGYATLFKNNYGLTFEVIRNVPNKNAEICQTGVLDQQLKKIHYQGALNIGRGLEETIMAMSQLQRHELHIYGEGPLQQKLTKLVNQKDLQANVKLFGAIRPTQLHSITPRAWVGLTLFSETGLHHKYSLANRFFDYFHAGIPQIAMNYPEYRAFNQQFEVALLIDDIKPTTIENAIKELSSNPELYNRLHQNCERAAEENCWEKESQKLINFYQEL